MTAATDTPPKAPSALAPFGYSAFAVLWSATVVSNTGTWMNDVGAGWLMTQLAPSPLMVSLVQAATALPVFLFALPAGALADIVDKRRMLIVIQIAMGIVAAAMFMTVATGAMTAPLLLLFTFALGTGAAFMQPAWQAIVPSLVPRDTLQPAVALNSVGINVSRAIGPALGGAIIAGLGIAYPFLLNALSFGIVLLALLWWKAPPPKAHSMPAERFRSAIVTGLRYARSSGPLKATLIRAVAFFLFASAYWALLPLIAREVLSGGASLYGLLLGAVGAGAVGGAFLLPALKKRWGPDGVVAAGTIGTAVTLLVFALIANPTVAIGASVLAGASWIAVLTNLNVSAQVALPDWVRARGLSVFLTVFFGSMTLGSILWGQVASLTSIPVALMIAAAGAVLFIPVTWAAKLQQGAKMDLAPASHWPEPITSEPVEDDRGPVMVQIEYRIDPAQADAFRTAMQPMEAARRRDGAFAWGLMQDAADPARFVEYFMEDSWQTHLRHHERVSKEDAALQREAAEFHIGDAPPTVEHLLG